MNDVGKRIQGLREKSKLNQSELARALSVTPQAVQKWESGGTPRGARLQDIARVLGTTAEYLLFGSITTISRFHVDHNTEAGPDIRDRLPLISWVQAGAWTETIDNFAPGDAEEWLPCPRTVGAHAFALRVRGISMEPKYRDGEIVFVDPDARAEHGKNVIVRLDGEQEATFKQLIVEGEHKFLKALNPDWPGPKLITINGNATICGVVIGKWVPE